MLRILTLDEIGFAGQMLCHPEHRRRRYPPQLLTHSASMLVLLRRIVQGIHLFSWRISNLLRLLEPNVYLAPATSSFSSALDLRLRGFCPG